MARIVCHNKATLKELLDFCNKVRLSGGGEILDKLLPGIVQDARSCLIARNLNFNCRVQSGFSLIEKVATISLDQNKILTYEDDEVKWYMIITDPVITKKISANLLLPIETILDAAIKGTQFEAILLPRKIGRCAAAFDAFDEEYYHLLR